MYKKKLFIFLICCLLCATSSVFAQEKSIGGDEHEMNIYGVKIGMDVPTALEAVFVNAKREPGQEKPDVLRKEGKDKKDIRVLYKDLPKGDLQIVFTDGKYVSQVILNYAGSLQYSDLRLPYTGDARVGLSGERFDDRYSVGYTDNQRLQRLWWRDEKVDDKYEVRLAFVSSNRIKKSQFGFQKIIQKTITVKPGDEENFLNTMKEDN